MSVERSVALVITVSRMVSSNVLPFASTRITFTPLFEATPPGFNSADLELKVVTPLRAAELDPRALIGRGGLPAPAASVIAPLFRGRRLAAA